MKRELGYIGCFAAGTLVHTAEGLQPIENIRVGMQVLSQPEDGGERGLRRVINKVAQLDQPVMAVQIKVEGDAQFTTLFATPNHPFCVEAPQVDHQHWMAAESLKPCMRLQLADGRSAEVQAAGFIRHTQHEDVFFAPDDSIGHGQVLCLFDGKLAVAPAERMSSPGPLTLGEQFVTPVYNFEVEEFHTYYVGAAGVWVHSQGDCINPPPRFVMWARSAQSARTGPSGSHRSSPCVCA